MKNIFFFLVLFQGLFFPLKAQNTRFIYQVTMRPDSTSTDVKTERARLDVSPEKSLFYGEQRAKRDSLLERMRATRNFDRNALQNLRSQLDYLVEKTRSKNTVTFTVRLGRDLYVYEEDRNMVWKILPETVKIGVYPTQKAETFFGGRKWQAWFTEEIPFPEGPYKFRGLPGLIVKLEDSKGDYSFDLMQTQRIFEMPVFENRTPPVKVRRTEFEKQEKLFRKDPVAFWASSFPSGGGFGGSGGMRGQMDPAARKQMEDRIREEVKKNNNPIELTK